MLKWNFKFYKLKLKFYVKIFHFNLKILNFELKIEHFYLTSSRTISYETRRLWCQTEEKIPPRDLFSHAMKISRDSLILRQSGIRTCSKEIESYIKTTVEERSTSIEPNVNKLSDTARGLWIEPKVNTTRVRLFVNCCKCLSVH